MKKSRKNALSFMEERSYYRECRAWFWEDDDPLEDAYEAGDCEQYASLIGIVTESCVLYFSGTAEVCAEINESDTEAWCSEVGGTYQAKPCPNAADYECDLRYKDEGDEGTAYWYFSDPNPDMYETLQGLFCEP